MDTLESLTDLDLAQVSGGNRIVRAVGKGVQSAYKWWTGADKAGTPKQIYDTGKEIAKDVGIGAGAIYGGKKIIDGMTAPAPSTTPQVPTGP